MPKTKEAQQPISKRHALQQVLEALPPPFGQAAPQQYSDLGIWHTAARLDNNAPVIDWIHMPASCDPCVLLDNTANTTRKKGVPIEQQVAMLQFNSVQQPAREQGSKLREAQQNQQSLQNTQQPGQDGQQQQPAYKTRLDITVDVTDDCSRMSRGWQKRRQVESFATILAGLLHQPRSQASTATSEDCATSAAASSLRQLHVVDFACGTGGLLLPLAHRFPHCQFTGVEMKRPALAILQQRAQMAGLTNVSCHLGMIEQFEQPFDVALGLHACGNATDQVLLLAAKHGAAFVVSSCCVGKIKFSMMGGSNFHPRLRTYHAVKEAQEKVPAASSETAQAGAPADSLTDSIGDSERPKAVAKKSEVASKLNDVAESVGETGPLEVVHPRSQAFRACLPDPEQNFKLIASFADTNFVQPSELNDSLEALSKSCKLHIELDRLMAAREAGYVCALHRIMPSGTTAKEELLVGVPCRVEQWAFLHSLLC